MKQLYQLAGVGSHNPNDCFVQSLTNALGRPYTECFNLAKKSGWTATGICPSLTFKALRGLGFTAKILGYARGARYLRFYTNPCDYKGYSKSVTLGTWLASKEAQTGTFVVGISRHVMCVRNGIIFDAHCNKSTSRIITIFQLA